MKTFRLLICTGLVAALIGHAAPAIAAAGDVSVVVGGPGRGRASNLSVAPYDIVTTPGRIYVFDYNFYVVRSIDLATGETEVVAGWPGDDATIDPASATSGTDGYLKDVGSIAVDPRDESVYITDEWRNRVYVVRDGRASIFAGGPNPADANLPGYDDAGMSDEAPQPARLAQLRAPRGVAVDSEGNVYISENRADRIRKVTPDGLMTTVADHPPTGIHPGVDHALAGDGIYPTGPEQLAVDEQDRVLFVDSDTFNDRYRILRVEANGELTRLDDEDALGEPQDISVTPSGEIIVLDLSWEDEYGMRVVRLEKDGSGTVLATFPWDSEPWPTSIAAGGDGTFLGIESYLNEHDGIYALGDEGSTQRIAGNGLYMTGGDGGLAQDAQLTRPQQVEVDEGGALYVWDDSSQAIRRINCDGTIETIEPDVPDFASFAVEGPGEMLMFDNDAGALIRYRGTAKSVVATSPEFRTALAPVPSPDGLYFLTDFDKVMLFDDSGSLTEIARANPLGSANQLTLGPDGDLWAAPVGQGVFRIDPGTGEVTNVIDDETPVVDPTKPNATESDPIDVGFDSAGDMFIADSWNGRVLRYGDDGVLRPVPGAARNRAVSLAFDSADNLFVADALFPQEYGQGMRDDAVRMVEGQGRAAACVPQPKDVTQLVYTGDTEGRGDTVHLAAALSSDGVPLADRELTFEIAGSIYRALTDSIGTAQVDVSVPDHGRSQTVLVTFTGDRQLESSQASATITWGKSRGGR